ncbi:MAG TPA: dethiobiotin synthase [Myxococcota bacterium]|nr:dethiobiotin synthase [Myxococcota bacterium]
MSAVFVTGTDTGAGKTAVACALARAARAAGLHVRVLKPIETGCARGADGELVPADALALAEAAGDDAPLARLCPHRFALPAAPEVAAAAEGASIALEPIAAALALAAKDADLVLVEGAGGLLVPIAPGLDMAGLAARFDLPIVVAARASLGTLNHTLLTLEAARARDLRVLGVVVSHTAKVHPDADRRNLDLLLARLPARFLGELAHGAQRIAGLDPLAFLTLAGSV